MSEETTLAEAPVDMDVHRSPTTQKTPRTPKTWLVRLLLGVFLGGSAVTMFVSDSPELIGSAAIVMMLSLLFLKIPVAFVLVGPGVLGLYALRPRSAETVLSLEPYAAVSQWSLTVIPMFVLMGLLLWRSGFTESIYVAARQWLGWMPGGLAVSTNTAGAGLAAVSGSTIGTTYALARMGVPEMIRAGYDRRLAVGAVIVAGLPGQLIPPSIFLVVYAGIAQVPVGPQLLAGIGPGLLVATMFGLTIVGISIIWPGLVGKERGRDAKPAATFTWSERRRSLWAIWPLPILIGVVLGGMYTGVLTATEAGAAGAFGALILTFVIQPPRKAVETVKEAAVETVSSVGAIFLLIIGAMILSKLLSISGIADGFTDWVTASGFSSTQFLLIVLVAYLVLGTFMEPLPIMLLTVPLLIPTLVDMDISLIWFGVFAVFLGELAVLTPPVGILSFIVHGIVRDPEVNLGQDISLNDVLTAVWWAMPVAIFTACLLIFFPEVATWIPEQMGG